MTSNEDKAGHRGHWESVHICPSCGNAINLAEIDLRAITTGIVACPRCEWAGRIDIQIVGEGIEKSNKAEEN